VRVAGRVVRRIVSYPGSGARVSDVDVWWQVRDAFALWSNVSRLTFVDVGDSQPADIDVSFVAGYHNDGSPFDGQGLSRGTPRARPIYKRSCDLS